MNALQKTLRNSAEAVKILQRRGKNRANDLRVLATVLGLRLGGLTELEGLATLEHVHVLSLALGAFQLEDNLLGGLGLLVENGLGLTTETGLLVVVTTLTLGGQGVLTLLVPFLKKQ